MLRRTAVQPSLIAAIGGKRVAAQAPGRCSDYRYPVVSNVHYAWDQANADANLAKHGISFTAAARALEDPRKIEVLDD
jgi:hypothetical protein